MRKTKNQGTSDMRARLSMNRRADIWLAIWRLAIEDCRGKRNIENKLLKDLVNSPWTSTIYWIDLQCFQSTNLWLVCRTKRKQCKTFCLEQREKFILKVWQNFKAYRYWSRASNGRNQWSWSPWWQRRRNWWNSNWCTHFDCRKCRSDCRPVPSTACWSYHECTFPLCWDGWFVWYVLFGMGKKF